MFCGVHFGAVLLFVGGSQRGIRGADAASIPDAVHGTLIQFNDNGAWTWYSDERAVVDSGRGKVIVGSVACQAGVGGHARTGDVESVIYDLNTGSGERFTLKRGASNPRAFLTDDHNTAAFLVRPDGKYLAWYSAHNAETKSYWRNYSGSGWSDEQVFDWTSLPQGTDFRATYSNPHYLRAEDRTYNFVRANDHGSPNILVSMDHGETWSFGGQLIASLTNMNVGYVSGYFKYCDNSVDRIDFMGTETHPRDSSTSMYHGYIKNGQSFRSDGTLVDKNILDQEAPFITQFTKIFTNGTVWPTGQTNFRCWNDDLQRYNDGTIEAIISTRINDDTRGNDARINPNHAFFFCRYDGTRWTSTYLCRAGYKLYPSEADYIGLGCLSPKDPDSVFVSTTYDPRLVSAGRADNSVPAAKCREIWKGVTHDRGATFTWTPITEHSTHDNLRPIVPSSDERYDVLLWFRASYSSAQTYDATPVGMIEHRGEKYEVRKFEPATTKNTRLATGGALVPGDKPGQWHWQPAGRKGHEVLSSADTIGEDAPALVTTVNVSNPGAYEVWVNFWCSIVTNADWRIMAGLSTNQMQIYRRMGCSSVPSAGRKGRGEPVTDGTNYLYQAYLGRVTVSNEGGLRVFVDDNAIKTGTAGPLTGDTVRTRYEGVSYARVKRQ